jgi:hypothetical protein
LRTKPELLEKVVKKFDLFEIKRSLFFSNTVLARLKIKQEKSETARIKAEKRWQSSGNVTAMLQQSNGNTNAILERKVVKGKKEKEKKVVKGKESVREKPKNENQTKAFLMEDPKRLVCNNGNNDQNGKPENKSDNERTTKKGNVQESAKAFKRAQTAGISDMVDDVFLPVLKSESPPKSNCYSSDIISDISVNTFKARVEYAKSLGIEDSIARRLCNFAQSKKFPLFKMHYESFVGKGEKEVGETFVLLNLLVQKTKKTSGLKRIWTG